MSRKWEITVYLHKPKSRNLEESGHQMFSSDDEQSTGQKRNNKRHKESNKFERERRLLSFGQLLRAFQEFYN